MYWQNSPVHASANGMCVGHAPVSTHVMMQFHRWYIAGTEDTTPVDALACPLNYNPVS
jgi:hypothetical protein